MPNWKKVILSGSNAVLAEITASGNLSGSGTATASYGLFTGSFGGDGTNLDLSSNTSISTSPFPFAGDGVISGSLLISSSNSTASLTLEGSGSTVFSVQGSQGQLFSLTDDLLHDNLVVNDISGDTLFKVSGSGLVTIPVGDLSGSGAATASYGHFIGDGSQLTNLNTTTPTLEQVVTAGASATGNVSITGSLIVSGSANVFKFDQTALIIGQEAGNSLTSFSVDNTMLGRRAGYETSTGDQNTLVGDQAGFKGDHTQDVAIGYLAGTGYTGGNNVSIGWYAGYGAAATSAEKHNTQIGAEAGRNNWRGSGNTFIGYRAGYNGYDNEGCIIIGSGSIGGPDTGAGGLTQQLRIGNSSIVTISGSLTTGDVTFYNTASAPNFSGSFQGNGSQLTNLPAASAGSTAGRVVFTTTGGALTTDSGFDYNSADDRLTVSNLTTTTFTASFITSSTIETSGSNIFGDEAGVDVQTLVGTTKMTGSAQITGSLDVSGAISAGSLTIDSKPTIDTYTSTIDELTLNPNGDWAAIRLNRDSHPRPIIVEGNITSSYNVSGSATSTASFGHYLGDGSQLTNLPASNPFPLTASSAAIISRSIAASDTDSTALRLFGSGSVSESGIFEVEGSAGPLFSVADGLDGVLMEVNNISGLPLFQVSSSNEVFVNRGNLTSDVTTATASFAYFTGSFAGDASGLTNVPAGSTPTLDAVTNQGNVTSNAITAGTISGSAFKLNNANALSHTGNVLYVGNANDWTTIELGRQTTDEIHVNGLLKAEQLLRAEQSAQITGSLTVSGSSLNLISGSFRVVSPTKGTMFNIDDNTFTLGPGASAGGGYTAVAIGNNASTGNNYSVSIGSGATTNANQYAVAIGGLGVSANGLGAVAIGGNTATAGAYGISMGYQAAGSGNYSINLGRSSNGSGANSVTFNTSGDTIAAPSNTRAFNLYLTDGTGEPDLVISASNASKLSGSSFTIEKSGSTVFEVIGSEGTLFSVDDDLDGTIFTANR